MSMLLLDIFYTLFQKSASCNSVTVNLYVNNKQEDSYNISFDR